MSDFRISVIGTRNRRVIMNEYDLPLVKECGMCEGYGHFWRPKIHGGNIPCIFCNETGYVELGELEIEQQDCDSKEK